MPPTVRPAGIGKRTRCSSGGQGKWCWPCTSGTRSFEGCGANSRDHRRVLGPLPPPFRQTMTFDNGTEFARHHDLPGLGIETLFSDAYSPWQKGGVENAIEQGLFRFEPPRGKLAIQSHTAHIFRPSKTEFITPKPLPSPISGQTSWPGNRQS